MSNDWIFKTNVYEVNLRQYTVEGTINAFGEHLHRLKDMGVETLWFMPLTPISQKNKKGTLGSYYACSNYTAVSQEFGTLDDFRSLVQKAHNLGLTVIIDWVANHTGWDHVWTAEHPEWYKKDENGQFKRASGMDDIIELDFSQAAVRSAMINAMEWWIEHTDIDGFRCDLAFWVELKFWKEAKSELQKRKPLLWLGELDMLDSPEFMQVFDAAYTWKWMHSCEKYYKEEISFNELMTVLENYSHSVGLKCWFTSNHDENSWNGTEYEKYGEMAELLAVFSCTWPGVPLIYSGQELPNRKRLQFFEKDVIAWNDSCALHQFYRNLLHLRKDFCALNAQAPVERVFSNVDKLLAFKRTDASSEILILLNFSDQAIPLKISDNPEWIDRDSGELLTGEVQLKKFGWKILVKK